MWAGTTRRLSARAYPTKIIPSPFDRRRRAIPCKYCLTVIIIIHRYVCQYNILLLLSRHGCFYWDRRPRFKTSAWAFIINIILLCYERYRFFPFVLKNFFKFFVWWLLVVPVRNPVIYDTIEQAQVLRLRRNRRKRVVCNMINGERISFYFQTKYNLPWV